MCSRRLLPSAFRSTTFFYRCVRCVGVSVCRVPSGFSWLLRLLSHSLPIHRSSGILRHHFRIWCDFFQPLDSIFRIFKVFPPFWWDSSSCFGDRRFHSASFRDFMQFLWVSLPFVRAVRLNFSYFQSQVQSDDVIIDFSCIFWAFWMRFRSSTRSTRCLDLLNSNAVR